MPGTISKSPSAMPSAASSTAKNSGVNISNPLITASRARGELPEATERSANTQMALTRGATTR